MNEIKTGISRGGAEYAEKIGIKGLKALGLDNKSFEVLRALRVSA